MYTSRRHGYTCDIIWLGRRHSFRDHPTGASRPTGTSHIYAPSLSGPLRGGPDACQRTKKGTPPTCPVPSPTACPPRCRPPPLPAPLAAYPPPSHLQPAALLPPLPAETAACQGRAAPGCLRRPPGLGRSGQVATTAAAAAAAAVAAAAGACACCSHLCPPISPQPLLAGCRFYHYLSFCLSRPGHGPRGSRRLAGPGLAAAATSAATTPHLCLR